MPVDELMNQLIKEELALMEKDYAYSLWKSWKCQERFGVSFEDYWVGLKKVHQ